MQQFAVSEPSPPADEEQDALRLQVEQIIAQRLERRNLTKGNSATHAATRPARAPTREPIEKPAGEDFDLPPDREADAFEQAFDAAPADARDELDLPESFAPRDALPPLAELETPERRRGERRQAERRNVEFMRTELQWSTSPDGEAKRSMLAGVSGFRPSRFALLGIAVLSAAVAMILVLNSAPSPEPVAEPIVIAAPSVPTARILVAASAIGAGQRLDGSSLSWHEIPASDLLPEYMAEETDPDALANADQSIARFPFFPGDPIRTDKLLDRTQMSLSTAMTPGMRGVSVVVTPEAAAGGFIKPDDRVDVVLAVNGVSRTILTDVRVLAINTQLGPSTTGDAAPDAAEAQRVFEGAARATLELDEKAAEVLVGAASAGSLTLTLRATSGFGQAGTEGRSGADQAIRLTSRFWTDNYSPAL